jgi:2-methylcitrate dehydratase PrpD
VQLADVPAPVVDAAKESLAYHLGLAFEGHFTDAGRRGVDLAYLLSNGAGDTPIIGQRRRANALDAVYANAELITAGQWDDYHTPTGLHLSVVLHPIVWALAAEHHRSGEELLAALIAGCDVACALAEPAPTIVPNYARRSNNVFAVFGAAAAAARLLHQDAERFAATLNLAGHLGMGVVEESGDPVPTSAMLARNGLFAAIASTPTPDAALRTIEGPNGMYVAFLGAVPTGLDERIDRLGRDFAILGCRWKRYPASGVYVTPIELTRMLRGREDLVADEVERVTVTMPEQLRDRSTYFERVFDDPAHAPANNSGSVRFQLAIVLLDGTTELSRYAELDQPEVTALVRRIERRFEAGHPFGWARVDIHTRDGRTLTAEADDWAMPPADIGAWLRRDGERLLTEEKVGRLQRMVARLETVDDVADIAGCLTPGGAGDL